MVAPGQWDEVRVVAGGEVRARMPFVFKTGILGGKRIVMPQLTQTLGPWLIPSNAKYARKLSHRQNLMIELIDQLPHFVRFTQNFHPSITDWLPFHWAGYQQTTRYTYRYNDLRDLDKLWQNAHESIRRSVRKARRQLVVTSEGSLSQFVDLITLTFARQQRTLPYPAPLLEQMYETCQRQNAGRLFFARDAQDQVHAAAYLVWDEHCAYYLLGGADPVLRNSGAQTLLLWEAIQFAATVAQEFDFEGSMVQSIERHFRQFGARQTPYFRIMRTRKLGWQVLDDLRVWRDYLHKKQNDKSG